MNITDSIKNKLQINKDLIKKVIRYFSIAAGIAALEIASFALFNSVLGINYLIATVLSVTISIILNWFLSKVYVFKVSRFKSHHEFILVAVASLIGLGIQLATISFCVEVLSLVPIIGKIIAICVTFMWNFWIRLKFIFKQS